MIIIYSYFQFLVIIFTLLGYFCTALPQDTDIVFQHLVKNLDYQVSPCENLYRNVCPRRLHRREMVHSKTARLLLETIKENHHHPMQQFAIVREEPRIIDHNFNVEVLVSEFHQRCSINSSTVSFLRLLQRFFNSEPGNVFLPQLSALAHSQDCRKATRSLQHILWSLHIPKPSSIITQVNSHISLLISATIGKLQKIQMKAKYLFEQMRALLIGWLKEDLPHLSSYIESSLNSVTLKFYGQEELRILREIFAIGNRYYRRCKHHEKATSLELTAVCHRMATQFIEHLIENEPTLRRYFAAYRFSSYNAIFDNNVVTILPQRLLLANTNYTSIFLGALSVLGHELSHAVVPRILQNSPLISHEIAYTFSKTCDDYRENRCSSGYETAIEDYADYLGLKLSLSIGAHIYGGRFNSQFEVSSRFTPAQLIFYAFGFSHCVANADKTDSRHSARYVRVNGAARMQQEFQRAFHCHAYDKMILRNPENDNSIN